MAKRTQAKPERNAFTPFEAPVRDVPADFKPLEVTPYRPPAEAAKEATPVATTTAPATGTEED